MKTRWVLPLIVAVLAGLGTLVIMDQVIRKAKRPEKEIPMVPVVVATGPLRASDKIGNEAIKVQRVYTSMVPEGHFTDVEEVVGRVLRSHVPANYPITEMCLQPKGALAGFESKIPPGYRAVSIKVDAWSSVAHMILPGSRVDVIAEVRDRRNRRLSKTILQNVQIAAVGSVTSRDDVGPRQGEPKSDRNVVTLFLTPREVEVLHERNRSRLTLALRSGADDSFYMTAEDQDVPDALLAPLEPEAAPPVVKDKIVEDVKPKKPRKFVTWEIHGDRVQQVTYILINGTWHRENSVNEYSTSPLSAMELPVLKLKTAEGSGQGAVPSGGGLDGDQADVERE